jgi:hypothetical protein
MKRKALLLVAVALYSFLIIPTAPLWAQSLQLPSKVDLTAPIINHDAPNQSFRSGDPVSIQATITDDAGIKEVTLFYRTMGKAEYSSINMERQQETYSASIPKEDAAEPGVEYYIQASDQAGNIALRGFSFSPLTVTVTPAAPEKKSDEAFTENLFPAEERAVAIKSDPTVTNPWYKKWWVWTIVGAVAIAGAAAAGGGGGGGGSDPAPNGAGGQTGAVNVTGPIPGR